MASPPLPDQGVADAHRASRHRAIGLGLGSGLVARVVGVVVSLLAVPVVTGTLGQQKYGAFVLITGLAALLPFSDFGVGGGLVTALGAAIGRDDVSEARSLVSAALLGLSAVSGVLLVLFLALSTVVDWATALGLGSEPYASRINEATVVFVVLFLLAVPCSLGNRVLQGLQRQHAANLWLAVIGPLVLIGYLVVRAAGGGLVEFAAVAGAAPLLVGLCSTVWVLGWRRPDLRPGRIHLRPAVTRRLMRLGGLFLVLTLAMAVAFETDPLVLSWVLGPNQVAIYAVTLRLFGLVVGVAALAFTPLWASFAEALSRGDVTWVRQTVWRSCAAGLVWAAAASTVLVLLADPLIDAWVGPAYRAPVGLLVAMGVWAVLQSGEMPLAMLLNGAGVVTFQAVAATVMAVTNLALSIVLTQAWGISGPVWGSVIAHTVCTALPLLWYLRYRFTWAPVAS